uniref:Uncharacterized protein n=1 Tax=Kalanchoe fedtschenkoi TaxID=63787 RepID=A0A7N0T4M8_KALFE
MYKQRKKLSAIDTDDDADENSLHAGPPAPADSTSTSAVRDSDPGRVKGSSSRGAAGLAKKDRVVWTIELNNRFIEAYNLLGHQGATPCRILELMNDPRLTRFHIASHLQKYRTHLREMREELNPRRSKFRYNFNDPNSCSGSHNGSVVRSVAHQPPVDPAESFTKFLSEMEDEELFALAQSQNQRIPSLSPASSRLSLGQDDISSSDLDLARILDSHEFNNIFSMLHNCVSRDTFSNSYVGLKISNEGELLLWDNAAAGQAAGQFLNLEPINLSSTDVTGSPREFSPSGVSCIGIDSPESCLYVGEVLDHLDSNIQ